MKKLYIIKSEAELGEFENEYAARLYYGKVKREELAQELLLNCELAEAEEQ